jgi:uncharacterized surface protein with fasciclin (FAS1) repeats
MLTE